MARKRAKSASAKDELPNPGDAFLMPLEDGRFGVCRVLRARTERGCPSVLVVASPWIGAEAPDPADPRLRETHRLTHHAWKNEPNLHWTSHPPPESFQRFGTIQPDAADRRRVCRKYGDWWFAYQLYQQWQWDHDREAVLREDREVAEQQAREREEADKARQSERSGLMKLEALLKKRRFADWKGCVPDAALTASRAIFREAIEAILALGASPKKQSILAILKWCIEELNELDEKHGHFIETTRREDLCDAVDEVVVACGLRDCEVLADRWREW